MKKVSLERDALVSGPTILWQTAAATSVKRPFKAFILSSIFLLPQWEVERQASSASACGILRNHTFYADTVVLAYRLPGE